MNEHAASEASAPAEALSLLEEIAARSLEPCDAPLRPNETLTAECLDVRHPSLAGRVLVRWSNATGSSGSVWAPTLHGLPVRVGDRVLLMRPANEPEPIVIGVIDGFSARPEPERSTAARVELHRDEAVRIASADGVPLVELFQGETGPVVRLLAPDVALELPGALRLSAKSLSFVAREGEIEIKAHDDVVIEGETINLN